MSDHPTERWGDESTELRITMHVEDITEGTTWAMTFPIVRDLDLERHVSVTDRSSTPTKAPVDQGSIVVQFKALHDVEDGTAMHLRVVQVSPPLDKQTTAM